MPTASWVIAVALSLQQQGASAAVGGQPQWTDDRPIVRMAQNLKRDLAELPHRDALLALGAGAGGSTLAGSADERLAGWVRRSGASLTYTPIGNLLGNAWLQGSAAIATYTIGAVQDSPEVAHIGGDLIRAQLLNGVLTSGTKLAASRTRPNGGSHSFPSGHTSATFASATVLAGHYGWKTGVPAYAVAAFTAWTRVRDHQHWLSDVVFGASVGIAAGRTVTLGHRRSAWTLVPAAVPGGGGIYVVKSR